MPAPFPCFPVSAEQEMLLRCLRVDSTSTPRQGSDSLVTREPHWSELGRLAMAHGVLPLVVRKLSLAGTTCPPTLRKDWQTQVQMQQRDSLQRCAELLAFQREMDAAGIPFLAFKGPVLAAAWYGDIGLRAFLDLDVLVKPSDAARAMDLLQQHGYRPEFPMEPRWQLRRLQAFGEITFLRDAPRGAVDLHCRLLPHQFSFAADPPDLWKRPKQVRIGSASIATLNAENTFFFLALHAAKHDWSSLKWICDIAQVMAAQDDLDWDRIGWRMRRMQCIHLVSVGLYLAERLLGAPLPPGQLPRGAMQRRRVEALACAAVRGWLQATATRPAHEPHWPWNSLFFQAMQQPRDRWRLLYATFFRPSPLELGMLPLPLWSEPLYAVIRPLRLLAKHGRAWLARGRKQ